jgi:hypothetical protein
VNADTIYIKVYEKLTNFSRRRFTMTVNAIQGNTQVPKTMQYQQVQQQQQQPQQVPEKPKEVPAAKQQDQTKVTDSINTFV